MCIRDRLYGAVETTYGSYNTLLEELEGYLTSGQDAKASQLYYNKVSVLSLIHI